MIKVIGKKKGWESGHVGGEDEVSSRVESGKGKGEREKGKGRELKWDEDGGSDGMSKMGRKVKEKDKSGQRIKGSG